MGSNSRVSCASNFTSGEQKSKVGKLPRVVARGARTEGGLAGTTYPKGAAFSPEKTNKGCLLVSYMDASPLVFAAGARLTACAEGQNTLCDRTSLRKRHSQQTRYIGRALLAVQTIRGTHPHKTKTAQRQRSDSRAQRHPSAATAARNKF